MIQTKDVTLSAVISLHSSDGANGWDGSADGTKAVLPGGPSHDCDAGWRAAWQCNHPDCSWCRWTTTTCLSGHIKFTRTKFICAFEEGPVGLGQRLHFNPHFLQVKILDYCVVRHGGWELLQDLHIDSLKPGRIIMPLARLCDSAATPNGVCMNQTQPPAGPVQPF